jgi:hypothetical protein
MTREQSIAWLRKRMTDDRDGFVWFWSVMAVIWGAILVLHVFSISQPFHFESVIVVLLISSLVNLSRIIQARKLKKVLSVLLGDSWEWNDARS